MSPSIATFAYVLLILALFWLARDSKLRASKALWIPVLWLLVASARPVSTWLHPDTVAATVSQFDNANPANDLVLSILMAAGVAVLVGRSARARKLLRLNRSVVLFFAYCGASVLWSDFPGVAARHWVRSLGDLEMVLVVLTDTDLAASLRTVITRPAFILIPLSTLLIKYYPNLGRHYNQWTFAPEYCGVATTKNTLGVMCLVFGLGCLWCFLEDYKIKGVAGRRRRLVAYAIVLVMTMWLLHTSNSMTSSSCFLTAGALLAFTILFEPLRRPGVIHFMVLAVVATPLIGLFSGLAGGLTEALGRNPTLTGRTQIWSAVLSVRGNSIVGTGFESFWLGHRLQEVWAMTMNGLNEAHNGYLEVYLNLGWIGVGLLAVLMVIGYRNAIGGLRWGGSVPPLRGAFLVAAAVYSITEVGFRMMNPIWIFLLLACSVGLEPHLQDNPPPLATENLHEADRHIFHPQCALSDSAQQEPIPFNVGQPQWP